MLTNTIIPYEGFTISYEEMEKWGFRFIIRDGKGKRAFPHKTFTHLAEAKEEVMLLVRSSLQYLPRTFTQWIERTTGREWELIRHNAKTSRRAWYYKQYAAYCAANSFPVEYDFEF